MNTPSAPAIRLKIYAAGMIIITYRKNDISREGIPLPRASKTPQQVTETAENTKPVHIICKAFTPMLIVAFLEVKSPII